jgi:hypothetical protein
MTISENLKEASNTNQKSTVFLGLTFLAVIGIMLFRLELVISSTRANLELVITFNRDFLERLLINRAVSV